LGDPRPNAATDQFHGIDALGKSRLVAAVLQGITTLAPLPKKALIRDLVSQIAPPDERL
jgi:hypothetical protein